VHDPEYTVLAREVTSRRSDEATLSRGPP
jgi:hypothetical protein